MIKIQFFLTEYLLPKL